LRTLRVVLTRRALSSFLILSFDPDPFPGHPQHTVSLLVRSLHSHAVRLLTGEVPRGLISVDREDEYIYKSVKALEILIQLASDKKYADIIRNILELPGGGSFSGSKLRTMLVSLSLHVVARAARLPWEERDALATAQSTPAVDDDDDDGSGGSHGGPWNVGRYRGQSVSTALDLVRRVLSVLPDTILDEKEEEDEAIYWSLFPAEMVRQDEAHQSLTHLFTAAGNMMATVRTAVEAAIKASPSMSRPTTPAPAGGSDVAPSIDSPSSSLAFQQARRRMDMACTMARTCYSVLDQLTSLCVDANVQQQVLKARAGSDVDKSRILAQMSVFSEALNLLAMTEHHATELAPPLSVDASVNHTLDPDDPDALMKVSSSSSPFALLPPDQICRLQLCVSQTLALLLVLGECAGEKEGEPCSLDVYNETEPALWAGGQVKARASQLMTQIFTLTGRVLAGEDTAASELAGWGQASNNLIRVVELFSNDTNYRMEMMSALAGPVVKCLTQPYEKFRSRWCAGRVAIDLHRRDHEEVFPVTETSLFHRTQIHKVACFLLGQANNMHEHLARGSAFADSVLLFKFIGNLISYYEGTCEPHLKTYFVDCMETALRASLGPATRHSSHPVGRLARAVETLSQVALLVQEHTPLGDPPADPEAVITSEEILLTRQCYEDLGPRFPEAQVPQVVMQVQSCSRTSFFGLTAVRERSMVNKKRAIPGERHRYIEPVNVDEVEEHVEMLHNTMDGKNFVKIHTVGTQRVINDQDIMEMGDDEHDDVDPCGIRASSDSDVEVGQVAWKKKQKKKQQEKRKRARRDRAREERKRAEALAVDVAMDVVQGNGTVDVSQVAQMVANGGLGGVGGLDPIKGPGALEALAKVVPGLELQGLKGTVSPAPAGTSKKGGTTGAASASRKKKKPVDENGGAGDDVDPATAGLVGGGGGGGGGGGSKRKAGGGASGARSAQRAKGGGGTKGAEKNVAGGGDGAGGLDPAMSGYSEGAQYTTATSLTDQSKQLMSEIDSMLASAPQSQ